MASAPGETGGPPSSGTLVERADRLPVRAQVHGYRSLDHDGRGRWRVVLVELDAVQVVSWLSLAGDFLKDDARRFQPAGFQIVKGDEHFLPLVGGYAAFPD